MVRGVSTTRVHSSFIGWQTLTFVIFLCLLCGVLGFTDRLVLASWMSHGGDIDWFQVVVIEQGAVSQCTRCGT